MVDLLKQELGAKDQQLAEKDKQIERLHILLKNANDLMLPAHSHGVPWWQRLFRREPAAAGS